MHETTLSDQEFAQFSQFIHGIAGIHMVPAKKPLIAGRLAKRLRHHGLTSFDDYYRLMCSEQAERQIAVDLLTTNETHFFRESRHFDLLRDGLLAGHPKSRVFRAWSAACSSGEEVFTLAMVLAESLGGGPWEILGSDISTRVLQQAASALYPMERAAGIPKVLLKRYCLKGIGSQSGRFLIAPELQERVSFAQVNLTEPLPSTGCFDVIFLRNIMIYFRLETKREVVGRLLERLRPGGWLVIGHSETLNGLAPGLECIAPAVYRKV